MDREELIQYLKQFKRKIESKYKAEKLVLFGSRATSKYTNESDVDLIVVGKFKGKHNLERAPQLYLEWTLNIPVDFLCYSSEEFKKLSKKGTIIHEALENGIIIE